MTNRKTDPIARLIKFGLPGLILGISIGIFFYGQSIQTEITNANEGTLRTFLYHDLDYDVDNITSIAVDNAGKTWNGINGCRLLTYDGREWTIIDLLVQPTDQDCFLYFRPDNKPLVGVTWWGPLPGLDCIGYYYDKDIWNCIIPPETEYRDVDVISYSNDNPIYTAHEGESLHLFYNGSWYTYPEDLFLVWTSFVDPDGAVWFGTSDGVIVFDDGKWIDFSDLGSTHVITFDHTNRIWLGSRDQGVRVYDGDEYVSYTENNSGLPSNRITGIAIANNGTAWIGTEERGVVSFDGKKWVHYTESNSGILDDDTKDLVYNSHLDQKKNDDDGVKKTGSPAEYP